MLRAWDTRRNLAVLEDAKTAVKYATNHWVECALESIKRHGKFVVALSGGSTPKAIFESITRPPFKERVPWGQIYLFWSDERSVPPDHPDSNYQMAMKAGLEEMPIPKNQIRRMIAEENIEENALTYEQEIYRCLNSKAFDLIMLGMGEDGHTASLFPHTQALHIRDRFVAPNFISKKNTWRMTLTYPCIENAKRTVVYVLGKDKNEVIARVLKGPDHPNNYPIQRVGSLQNPSFWILDSPAASLL